MPVIRQNRDKGLGLWLGLGLRFGLGYTYSVFNTNEMLQSQHQFVACLIKGLSMDPKVGSSIPTRNFSQEYIFAL